MTPLPKDSILGLADALLSATDSSTRAGLVAEAVVELLGDGACVVHRAILGEDGPQLSPIALAGPVSLSDAAIPNDSRLPQLLSDTSRPIYFVEGEKDADRLKAAGLLSTTASQGASAKWQPELTKWFVGRDVFIIPDNVRRHTRCRCHPLR